MDYQEARGILGRLPSLEVKPGLERTLRLLDALGHPERSFPSVHVAGTNGKGSVTAMLASVLEEAGYRVGRYTSPEVEDFRDRIAVDGRWITEAEFAGCVERLLPALEAAQRPANPVRDAHGDRLRPLRFEARSRSRLWKWASEGGTTRRTWSIPSFRS